MPPTKKAAKKSQRVLTLDSVLSVVIDGKTNLNLAQACSLLCLAPAGVYELVKRKFLHPVRVGAVLVFARTELEQYRANMLETQIVKQLEQGLHPIDVYQTMERSMKLKDIDRVLHDWAKLAGVWLVEAPRGSYARWLARFEITRVSPRGLRRMIEALLSDPELGERVRVYFRDMRALNGGGEEKALARAPTRRRPATPKEPQATTG